MRTQPLMAIGVVLGVVGACGGDPPIAATVAATADIRFEPARVEVAAGGQVTWEFGGVAHNVFFTSGSPPPADIPDENANTTASRTFPAAGTYDYECRIHPGMQGRVLVATRASPPPGPSGPY